MVEQRELHKYALGELAEEFGYWLKPLKSFSFQREKTDIITLEFHDGGVLSIHYDLDSLMLVRYAVDYEVEKTLIPEGMPTKDSHYCDILSFVSKADISVEGEVYENQEVFSQESLDAMLGEIKGMPLTNVEMPFGLQHWTNLSFKDKTIGFKFFKESIPYAIFKKDDVEIAYKV